MKTQSDIRWRNFPDMGLKRRKKILAYMVRRELRQ